MLPVERVIGDSGLRSCAAGMRLAVRLPWYRSLPLSTVEITGLSIDGTDVDLACLRFEIDGGSWTLDELAEQVDCFWYVLDEADLLVPGLVLDPDSSHAVTATLVLHPPYIPGMRRSNSQTETLVVGKEAAR